jgi:hypothetical protein
MWKLKSNVSEKRLLPTIWRSDNFMTKQTEIAKRHTGTGT